MDLDAVLDRVSRNCLYGQPVPPDLRRLWQAQLEGDTEPLDAADLVLVDVLAPNFFEGYREQDGVPPESPRGYLRMFEQIAFIGQFEDGGLLGYWLAEGRCPVQEAPVVELDSEGQFALWGTTLSECLLLKADRGTGFDAIRSWLEAHGIAVRVDRHDDIWQKLEAFLDPNAQAYRYEDEERAKG